MCRHSVLFYTHLLGTLCKPDRILRNVVNKDVKIALRNVITKCLRWFGAAFRSNVCMRGKHSTGIIPDQKHQHLNDYNHHHMTQQSSSPHHQSNCGTTTGQSKTFYSNRIKTSKTAYYLAGYYETHRHRKQPSAPTKSEIEAPQNTDRESLSVNDEWDIASC